MRRLGSHAGLAVRSVRFHWAIAASIGLGVAIATAVITGALVVGDSMRASLRGLTIDRLGDVDQAIIPGGFFSVERLPETLAGRTLYPLILFDRAVIETGSGDRLRRAGSVQVFGIEDDFWQLDPMRVDPVEFETEQIVINAALAEELRLEVGDMVTVRLPAEQAVPADSPLGRRDVQTEGIPRLEVAAIIDNQGLGRFALQPNQAEPLSVWLHRELIADTLQRPGRANVLLVSVGEDADPAEQADWGRQLSLGLEDFGLRVERVRSRFGSEDDDADDQQVIFDYFSVSSERLLLPDAAVEAITAAIPQAKPVMTYLANAIERVDDDGQVIASVPYSTITATDSSEALPLDFDLPAAADVADHEARPVPIVLNDWTAESLSASVGDRLRIAYFEPEVEGGREIERSFDGVLTAIVPITEPSRPYRRRVSAVFESPPTVYNDPDLTPTVPGVTDQDSISDWDLPFRLQREIRPEDDRYWNEHRLTPKAFLPLEDGRRLFGSRFGDTTSLRIEVGDVGEDEADISQRVLAALAPYRERLGWAVIPLRQMQLEASRGTTPFDALFLSLSFFVILAALMLIALLFRLGLIQRAGEYGVLLATGFPGTAVSRLAVLEGAWIALPGILLGVLGGLGYAAVVLAGLRSWWVGAVTVPFLQFHATFTSLLIGALAGGLVSLATVYLTARRLRLTPARELLAGRVDSPQMDRGTSAGRRLALLLRGVPLLLVVVAVAVGVAGIGQGGPAQAGAFVGGGMLLLLAALLAMHARLASAPRRAARQGGRDTTARQDASVNPLARRYSLWRLAWGNVGRNPLRSTLSIGLMASASFLIVSISAFQLTPSESGVGGFDLIGRSATPLYRDLDDPSVRAELLGAEAEPLGQLEVVSMRLQPGQDASCNNLYQASQPQVYGVPPSMARFTSETPFQWAATTVSGDDSPWDALDVEASGSEQDPIPLILDQNTAMWSLQMRDGVGELRSFSWNDSPPVHFRVVGLLNNTVLQGSLMIGEENFQRIFPRINGYQVFLARAERAEQARMVLENRLGDIGMDVTATRTVLARLMAVQNTYLRTFQSLGALGLLLGTVGLAIAQLRNALERQGELAVMRAIGFARRRLASAVMLETAAVLVAGIGSGVLCAAIAVTPYLWTGQSIPPVIGPLVSVVLIALFGLLAGLLAVARVVHLPLVAALRK